MKVVRSDVLSSGVSLRLISYPEVITVIAAGISVIPSLILGPEVLPGIMQVDMHAARLSDLCCARGDGIIYIPIVSRRERCHLVVIVLIELLDQFRVILPVSHVSLTETGTHSITSLEPRESISQHIDLLGLCIRCNFLTRLGVYLQISHTLVIGRGRTRAAFGPLYLQLKSVRSMDLLTSLEIGHNLAISPGVTRLHLHLRNTTFCTCTSAPTLGFTSWYGCMLLHTTIEFFDQTFDIIMEGVTWNIDCSNDISALPSQPIPQMWLQ